MCCTGKPAIKAVTRTFMKNTTRPKTVTYRVKNIKRRRQYCYETNMAIPHLSLHVKYCRTTRHLASYSCYPSPITQTDLFTMQEGQWCTSKIHIQICLTVLYYTNGDNAALFFFISYKSYCQLKVMFRRNSHYISIKII